MSENIEHVDMLEDTQVDRALTVTFAAVVNPSDNGPRYRYTVPVGSGIFANVMIEGAIFLRKSGKYSVSLPGGSFPCLRPVQTKEVTRSGRNVVVDDPDGRDVIDSLPSAILTAFETYLRKPEKDTYRITL